MGFFRMGLSIIATLGAMGAWAFLALWGAFEGYWMRPISAEGDYQSFFQRAVSRIDGVGHGAAALVLIDEGRVVGEYYGDGERAVSADTVFPTASLSKWITALGVLHLAETGGIDLDAPVETYLSRWQLPEGEFDNAGVTVARLLSHTAGLTDGLGFGDYAGEETLPALEQSLRAPRCSACSDAVIAVGQEPGQGFVYSGGGYLVLQLVVEEVTGQSFASYMEETIFAPLGMENSSYDYVGVLPNVAPNYNAEGDIVPHFQYAAAAATGFSSSARDLTRLSLALARADAEAPVSSGTLTQMRTPHARMFGQPLWGLGAILYAPTVDDDFVYGHDGANEPAINAAVRINPRTGSAYIMLVTGNPRLATEIGADWVLWQTGRPDVFSTEKAFMSAVAPSILGWAVILFAVASMALLRRREVVGE